MSENLTAQYEKVLGRQTIHDLVTLGFQLATTQPQDINLDSIKSKYRLLIRRTHPDVNKEANAEGKTKALNEAYERLSDEAPGIERLLSKFFSPDTQTSAQVTSSETSEVDRLSIAIEKIIALLNQPILIDNRVRSTLLKQYQLFFKGVLEAKLGIHHYQYRNHGNEQQLFRNLLDQVAATQMVPQFKDEEVQDLRRPYDMALSQVFSYFQNIFTPSEMVTIFKRTGDNESPFYLDIPELKSLIKVKIADPQKTYTTIASLRIIKNLSLSFPVSEAVNKFGLLSGEALIEELGLSEVLKMFS